MTAISATSGSNYLSPLQLLQNELQTEVSSGAISSTDQGALSSALNDINSSLQSDSPSSSTGGSNATPGDLKSKIDSLIAGEVSSGKLTSDQATELQGVFAAAFANGPGGAGDASSASGASAAGGALRQPVPADRAVQADQVALTAAIMAAMAVRRPPAVRPPVHPRTAAPAGHRAPPPTTSCSNFCNRCRIRCRVRRHRPTARVAAAPPAAAVRHSRRC